MITLLTAATPDTRSCIQCNQKTLTKEALNLTKTPDDESYAGSKQSEIMSLLLDNIFICMYCGNRLRQ
jgi:hypothetical protein